MIELRKGAAVITCLPAAAPAVMWMAANAGTIAAVASAGVGAYSAYQSGQSQKKAARYNEKMGEYQALDAAQRGADRAAAVKDRARRFAATQAEGIAASGVSLTSGTPLDLLVETAGMGELDALTEMNNAKREAWGHRAQGKLDRYQGKMAARGGILNAGGTFLGGASSAYFGSRAA